MIKEYKFKKLTKLVENGYQQHKVLFDGEEVGSIQKTRYGWESRSINGRFIGTGITKGEAKEMVALDFYGDENIIWKD